MGSPNEFHLCRRDEAVKPSLCWSDFVAQADRIRRSGVGIGCLGCGRWKYRFQRSVKSFPPPSPSPLPSPQPQQRDPYMNLISLSLTHCNTHRQAHARAHIRARAHTHTHTCAHCTRKSFVHCCFASTETTRLIRDGEPRTATSTFTQLLSSESTRKKTDSIFIYQLFLACDADSPRQMHGCGLLTSSR